MSLLLGGLTSPYVTQQSEPPPASHRGCQERQLAPLAGADPSRDTEQRGAACGRDGRAPRQVGRHRDARFTADGLVFPDLKSEQGDLDTVPTDCLPVRCCSDSAPECGGGAVCNGNIIHALLTGPPGCIETACCFRLPRNEPPPSPPLASVSPPPRDVLGQHFG